MNDEDVEKRKEDKSDSIWKKFIVPIPILDRLKLEDNYVAGYTFYDSVMNIKTVFDLLVENKLIDAKVFGQVYEDFATKISLCKKE